MALVDLFDPRHARKVLAAFGRAFAALPERADGLSTDQEAFLDQAVAGLAQEGKVISVRLALFAEMMKGKTWTPITLKKVGGMEGVGVTFLEETFATSTASPQHRLHQKAAQAVLKALLPDSGTDIKGNMRSQRQLLDASGYAARPKDFDALLRILDGELRLLTPTDPEGAEGLPARSASDGTKFPSLALRAGEDKRYYQLTHDYLVHSLRDWLTRKQKETRRGRAELLLADRAAVWNARPENRQLPSLLQWLQICWRTRKKDWTPPQRKMMRNATRYHAARTLVVAAVLALVGWGAYEGNGVFQARALRDKLLAANTNEVPAIVRDMAPYRRWIDLLLKDAYNSAEANQDRGKHLHASLALLPVDGGQVNYVYERLLDANPDEVPVIRDALAPHKDELLDKLWQVAEQPTKGKEGQRLRAAAALASYDPDSERWAKVNEPVANDLVGAQAVYLAQWLESLRPVRDKLQSPLSAIFRDRRPERAAERTLAANYLAYYAADQPPVLADLLLDADDKQFAVLFPKLLAAGDRGGVVLQEEVDRKPRPDANEDAKEKLAKRQANAAVALLRKNQTGKVWPLLAYDPSKNPDPRARSYLIHRFGPLGADAAALVKRLDEERDVTIRRALILSLGPEEYRADAWTPGQKPLVVRQLQEMYRTEPEPGLHAAAEWLLRQWHEQPDDGWAKDQEQRDKRLEAITQELRKEKAKAKPQWYVNSQGQTMVVIPGPVEFTMGSPADDAERYDNETTHGQRIGRTFAIAAKPVTVDEYRTYNKKYTFIERYAPAGNCPVVSTSWFQAAAYCNWLSEQEKLEKCYGDDGKGNVTKLKANYLGLNGYRLPTEAEWEYACRAGAATSRYYGVSVDLLDKYSWYVPNGQDRSWPVGSKKPNDWGLFDMHGNVWNWCQERFKDYLPGKDGQIYDDNEDIVTIKLEESRLMRGGALSRSAP